jgi:hypothetical protein
MEKLKTPDVAVEFHHCPKNYDGSSKGMEAKAAMDCLNKVWTHAQVRAFIACICIDDDATTKAHLQHSFEDLAEKGLPRPTTKKGKPKTGEKNNKGRLPKDHPVLDFLADLSHRVRTYGKYLWVLKNQGKKRSEMTLVDSLRLKRNFAWWLFSGINITYDQFRDSAQSPVLHHFNDHTQCGTWCRHRTKTKAQLGLLKKYRCKEANNKLYLQCLEILERFTSEAHLRECHHRMSSQKNEAMNKSIIRYVPKDKTLCKTMSLTSRLCMAISIDSIGHSEFYVRLFAAMKFEATELTFSGLRRMWRKKEYGRIRQGRKKVKLDRRLALRKLMIEGCKKQEKDIEEGLAYSSGMRMADENEGESEGEERPTKKARKATDNSNKRTTGATCRCGGQDHKRITSKACPWKGLSQKEISEKYAVRINEEETNEASEKSAEHAGGMLDPTDADCAEQPTTVPTGKDEVIVQSTSKLF